jgi:hypothetical protein
VSLPEFLLGTTVYRRFARNMGLGLTMCGRWRVRQDH